jgi:hypothetical protein
VINPTFNVVARGSITFGQHIDGDETLSSRFANQYDAVNSFNNLHLLSRPEGRFLYLREPNNHQDSRS